MLLIIAINITFPNLRTFRFKQSASPQCQEQLTRKQKIISQDFEAAVANPLLPRKEHPGQARGFVAVRGRDQGDQTRDDARRRWTPCSGRPRS